MPRDELEAEILQPTAKAKRSSRWLSPRGREMTSLGSRPVPER